MDIRVAGLLQRASFNRSGAIESMTLNDSDVVNNVLIRKYSFRVSVPWLHGRAEGPANGCH